MHMGGFPTQLVLEKPLIRKLTYGGLNSMLHPYRCLHIKFKLLMLDKQ